MKMTKAILVTTGAALGLGFGYFQVTSSDSEGVRAGNELSVDEAKPPGDARGAASSTLREQRVTQRRVNVLRNKIARLERRLDNEVNDKSTSDVSEREPSPDEIARRIEEKRRVSEQRQSLLQESIAEEYEEEPIDAAWSGEKSVALQLAFEQSHAANFELQELECRSRFCRMVIQPDVKAEQGAELDSLFDGSELAAGSYFYRDSESGSTVAYVIREGYFGAFQDVLRRVSLAMPGEYL